LFAGKQVSLPLDWMGTAGSVDVNMVKYPRTLLSGTFPNSGISIGRIEIDPGTDDKTVVENWSKLHAVLSSGTDIVSSSRNEPNLICVIKSRKQLPDRVNVSCLAYPAMIHAECFGNVRDIPVFFAIVRQLR